MTRNARPTSDLRSASESHFELGALFEFSAIINASLDLKFILGHFLLTLMGKLLSLRGIVLLGSPGSCFRVETVKGLPADLVGKEIAVRRVPKRLLYLDKPAGAGQEWLKELKAWGIRLVVPLIAQDKIVGIAGFAPGILKKKLTEKEGTYVRSLGNIAASAVEKNLIIAELSRVNRRLDGKIQEMNTLFELSKEFNAILDPDRLLKLLIFSIMGQIGASRYLICLEQNGTLNVVASKLDREVPPTAVSLLHAITGPFVVSSITKKSDLHLRHLLEEMGIQVAVPLQMQNQTKGILALGEKMRGGGYSPTDVEFLASLGNLAFISLENARLFKEAIEKQRLEDELLIAKEIQRGLLPAKLPAVKGYDLAATNISSKQVGGDYYDVIALGGHKYVIAIGDVSGKGTPASLLMANLQAMIRALVPLGLSLAELTRRVNDLICENTGTDRFITFFWGILDSAGRTMKYVSAGHNPPFLFHTDGSVERLDKGGIILGLMKAMVPYQDGEVRIGVGDVLVLFTDGVSESMDTRGEEMGEEKLEAVARQQVGEPAAVILAKIVEAVKDHSRNAPQSDDITLVVAKAVA